MKIFIIGALIVSSSLNKAYTGNLMDKYTYTLQQEEGLRKEAYKPIPSEKEYTIGYGNYGSHVKQGDTVTKEEATQNLVKNIEKRIITLKLSFPKWKSFSDNLKVRLMSAQFRGSLPGSPKTKKLINKGKFKEASKEFLNNKEYINAVDLGKPGIRPRMEQTAQALFDEE